MVRARGVGDLPVALGMEEMVRQVKTIEFAPPNPLWSPTTASAGR